MKNKSSTHERKNLTRLSIAIPVYKRPELLSRCLKSVIAATSRFSVPIFIYDDSLSQINKIVIDQAKNSYPLIYHELNEANLGIDENIAKCIENTPSEYVWLLGEDDLLTSDAVESMLQVINKYCTPYIFVNYSYISNDYSKIIRQQRLDFHEDCVIDGREFFEQYLWASGFIGGCLISSVAWKSIDRVKYKGTFFSHVGVISELIYNKKVPLVSRPLVLNRAEDLSSTSWGAQSFDVNFGWDNMLTTAGHVFGEESLRKARISSEIIFWHRSLLFLISKRADGIYGLTTFFKYINHNNFSIIYKLSAAIVAILPIIIFKVTKKIIKPTFKDFVKRLFRRFSRA